MVTLTSAAIDKVKKISVEDKIEPMRLRVKVVGGGCAGFRYDLYFDELEPSDIDEVNEQDGVTVVVDPLSAQYLEGTTIDYVKSEFSEGFKFENPNVTSTCGCGSSFQ